MSVHENSFIQNQNPQHELVQRLPAALRNIPPWEQAIRNSNVVRVLVYFCISVIVWVILSILLSDFILQRRPLKLGDKWLMDNVVKLSGPDQTSYRSYHYFLQIINLAKQNVKNNRTYHEGDKQFNEINFYELYQLFKVVKMIEKANEYTLSEIPEDKTDNDNDKPNLNKPVNLSYLFGPVVDQFSCSSCYSFPITATIQALFKKNKNITIKLSQQQLIDCAKDQYVDGCKSGNITRGFQYVKQHGLVQEQFYPYQSRGGTSYKCRKEQISKNQSYKIKNFRRLRQNDCEAIKASLQNGIPVAVMINAGRLSQLKKGEVFEDCSPQQLNHAVTIVGINQKQEWIVRNSWSDTFGQGGYFLMKAGKKCGTCRFAIVPQLEQSSQKQQSNDQL